jgi:nucleoside-diphosphate kinase
LATVADALVILKPDSAHRLAARSAVWRWLCEERDWKLVGLTWHRPSTSLIETHYDFLRGRPFFPWLVDFMSALPVLVGRVEASANVLERMRYELGETRIPEARPGSLRERFGIGGGVNVLHLSDSPETGQSEVALWADQVQLDRLDVELGGDGTRPDHTFHLRSLASQFAAGVHTDLAREHIARLLREESELEGAEFEALVRVVLGAFG